MKDTITIELPRGWAAREMIDSLRRGTINGTMGAHLSRGDSKTLADAIDKAVAGEKKEAA